MKKNDQNEVGTFPELILRILKDPKLLLIALPILAVATFVYIKYFIHGNDQSTHSQPPCKQWTLSGRLMSVSGIYLSIRGVKVGIESGPFSDDDQITNGIFRITNVDLPDDKFIQLYLEHNSTMYLFFRSPFNKMQIEIDTNNCTYILRENLTVPDSILRAISPLVPLIPPDHHPPPPNTFSINISDPSIRKSIAEKANLKYDDASQKNRIIITYDPANVVSSGSSPITYTFKPSPAIVVINGVKHPLDSCIIPEPVSGSHQIEKMKSYGDKQSIEIATPFIRQHPELIAKWVKSPIY